MMIINDDDCDNFVHDTSFSCEIVLPEEAQHPFFGHYSVRQGGEGGVKEGGGVTDKIALTRIQTPVFTLFS